MLMVESCDRSLMHAEPWRQAELARLVKVDNSGGLRLADDPTEREREIPDDRRLNALISLINLTVSVCHLSGGLSV